MPRWRSSSRAQVSASGLTSSHACQRSLRYQAANLSARSRLASGYTGIPWTAAMQARLQSTFSSRDMCASISASNVCEQTTMRSGNSRMRSSSAKNRSCSAVKEEKKSRSLRSTHTKPSIGPFGPTSQ